MYESFPTTRFSAFVLSLWTACLATRSFFLHQNSFSEERVEDNFSIDSILDGLVACDEPVSQNSCKEELKQVVTEKSIKTQKSKANSPTTASVQQQQLEH